MMKKNMKLLIDAFFYAFLCCVSVQVFAGQLAAPRINLVDRMGVNAHSGQVVVTIPTLSIGGEYGLDHKVSSSSSNFIQQNGGGAYVGLFDKYFGAAVYTKLVPQGVAFENYDIYSAYNPNDHFRDTNSGIWVMRVHDHDGSAEFKVMSNNYARGYFYSESTSYFYEALRDKRQTLEIPAGMPGHLLWTKADGTKTWFYRGISNVYARTKGYITKIEYPDGFTLYFDRDVGNSVGINSVRTNTGYQLKYNFEFDNTSSYGVGAGNTYYENPNENNLTWSRQNAASIIGINNAFENCSDNSSMVCVSNEKSCPSLVSGQSCSKLDHRWPQATFSWPDGMPRAIFFGENTYSVTDASGRTAEVVLKAYDKYANENGNSIASGYPVGQAFAPRVKSVKPAGSSSPTVSYTYKNYQNWNTVDVRWANGQSGPGSHFPGGYIYSVPGEMGLVRTAVGINGSYFNYTDGINQTIFPYATGYLAADGLFVKKLHQFFGALMYVQSPTQIVTYHLDHRNLPHVKATGDSPAEVYFYDSRGNLEKIVSASIDNSDVLETEASFPSVCTNRKTCNQATWVKDARGNKTHYTYHSQSGNVETITYPENKHGVSPQTRFVYQQFFANYYKPDGTKSVADDPVWLKKYEKYCLKSAYSGSACADGDEVVVEFNYDDDNLNLTSKVVYDPITDKSQKTCFEYDKYGYQIGETSAKGSCS